MSQIRFGHQTFLVMLHCQKMKLRPIRLTFM